MAVLVDTPIWSLAFRRRQANLNLVESQHNSQLTELIQGGRAKIIGPVRQEALSGIRDLAVFHGIRTALRFFPDEPLSPDDYEEAALVSNRCRTAGIAGSPVDFLICAVAFRRNWEIFTLDRDFHHYVKLVKIRLHQPLNAG